MIMLFFIPLFIGTSELLLIGGLALLLFGGKKLPEMMRGLGQGVQSFKKGMNEPVSEEEKEMLQGNVKNEDKVEQKQEDAKQIENEEQK